MVRPVVGTVLPPGGASRVGTSDLAGRALAPLPPATRQFVTMLVRFMAGLAAEHDVPPTDLDALRAAAADPDRLLDDPDFCLREAFVVTVGRAMGREA